MAAMLEEIALQTDANPRRNVHANKARVNALREVNPPSAPKQVVSYRGTLGQELLHAGENLEAIEIFKSILQLVESNPGEFDQYTGITMKDFLALSYMRLGEQENCIDNHNIDRCILPIKEAGVHTHQRGSRSAIELYTDILREDPEDKNSLWLLNVAYMTLGEYPEKVPPEWLIPPEAFEAEYDIGSFKDIAMQLGVNTSGLSGGAIMEDFNNDGRLDLMASSWGLRDPLVYLEQSKEGVFVDKSDQTGLDGIVGGLNLIHADYDNDGKVDVFVLRGGWLGEGHPNSLLRNKGNGRFEDVTIEAGLFSMHPTQTADWGDYNNDGFLDLFIGNETSPHGGRHRSELFKNNGDGTFTEVSKEIGLHVLRFVKGATWGDYNNDGSLDLYLSNWQGPNLLYRNDGPDEAGLWQFTEVAKEAGVQWPDISFPTWFWDYDNDGWEDIFVAGWKASAGDIAAEYLGLPHSAEYPRLYRNKGDGTFENVTADAGVAKIMYAMGSNFGDLDNDGYLDFYVGTGDPDFRSLIPNRMFRNDAGKVFQEVTSSGGFGHLQKGHGVAFGDYDKDGDQDIFAVIGGAYEGDVFNNVFFENPGHGNNWITLKLEGTKSNKSAIGTRIKVEISDTQQTRTVHRTVGTGGTFGANTLQLEIGLGKATAINTVEIHWPTTGETQRFENVDMNRAYRIVEGKNKLWTE